MRAPSSEVSYIGQWLNQQLATDLGELNGAAGMLFTKPDHGTRVKAAWESLAGQTGHLHFCSLPEPSTG